MMEISPTPWSVGGFDTLIYAANSKIVAHVNGSGPEQLAKNARLIAAAPEMLAMLERIVRDPSVVEKEKIKLYELIVKAGGTFRCSPLSK
jgi:hypothetical protein